LPLTLHCDVHYHGTRSPAKFVHSLPATLDANQRLRNIKPSVIVCTVRLHESVDWRARIEVGIGGDAVASGVDVELPLLLVSFGCITRVFIILNTVITFTDGRRQRSGRYE
jgi:hypothetical protein